MKIIEVKNFSFRYANGDRDSLENVTLDVDIIYAMLDPRIRYE